MRQFRTSHLVIGFSIFTIIVVWCLFAFEMWTQRRDSIDRVVAEEHRLVQVLEAHLQRTIEMVNLILDNTEHYALNEVIGMPPLNSEGSRLLGNTVKDMPYIAGLAIVGANGIADQGIEIFEDGISKTMSKRFDAREREYFTVFKENPNREIFIGKPIKTRTSGRWVVPISRSVLDASGNFKGINIAIVRLETFGDIFDLVRPKNSLLTVYLSDGKVFVKSPYNPNKKLGDEKKIGQQILDSASRPSGTINETMTNKGNLELISYRFASNWPFIIVLKTPIESILTNWRQGVKRQILTGILATIVFGGLAFVLIFQISRREQTESELRKLSSAIKQSPNAVFITDLQGTIEYVNPKFEELTGFTQEEALGQNPRILKSPDTAETLYSDLWRTIGRGDEWKGEIKDQRKDGSHFWAFETIAPVKDEMGEITHYVATHEDITERKDAELVVQTALKKSEIASRAKSDLLANMSHELRTPLNAIIGFSETMIMEVFGPLGNDKYLEYLGDINHSGQHLLELINDILDTSAIEADALKLHEENVNLADTIDVSVRLIKHRAEVGQVNVSISNNSEIPLLYADERRVKQILLNLLSNAVKFTLEGGEVSISVKLNENGSLAVSVADTGIGMDAEGVKKALSAFGQVDSGLDRKHEGTGLGLPLTKGLIELHGGTLGIESEKGKSTSVTVIFPKERVVQTSA